MRVRLIIAGILFAVYSVIGAQTMIGKTKLEVQEIVRKDYKRFRRDNSIVKQHYNYLKYVNGMKTKTWILYFTDNDICKTSKLVCDYAEYDNVIKDLSASFEKVGESHWEYGKGKNTMQVILLKKEWYFTVRETRKEKEKEIENK